MIDEFGLYPREEPFDPFSVMLFKALQVVSFLFFLALLAISPEAKDGKIDSKAEFIITMDWPDRHPDDLDLFVQDPAGNIAWYRHREAGFMVLDRDDRGGANDFIVVNMKKISSPIREEIVTIRGIVPGEYTVNVSHFVATTNAATATATVAFRATDTQLNLVTAGSGTIAPVPVVSKPSWGANGFGFDVETDLNQLLVIRYSTDLLTWNTLFTTNSPGTTVHIPIPIQAGANGFFRVQNGP